jgi:hypothetical protein
MVELIRACERNAVWHSAEAANKNLRHRKYLQPERIDQIMLDDLLTLFIRACH